MSREHFDDDKDKKKDASAIIILPNFERLKKEVEKLRIEWSMLVTEYDELQYVECKNIEMKYLLMFGSLEYKAYELECAALRLKRKIELIQAKRNRQEKVVLSQIEKTLDIEFAEYQQKLNEQMEKMNNALKRNQCEMLSDEESKELKKLYRNIVKELHPDLHPDNTPQQITLFENAVAAYGDGDLDTLRIISEMVCTTVLPDKNEGAMTQLVKEKERLTKLFQSIKDDIQKIQSEYPYTVKEFVTDREKSEKHKVQLQDMISQYNELIVIYTAKIEKMQG